MLNMVTPEFEGVFMFEMGQKDQEPIWIYA